MMGFFLFFWGERKIVEQNYIDLNREKNRKASETALEALMQSRKRTRRM